MWEGIHLRALGRETPIDEFHRIAIAEFSRFFTTAYQRAAGTFTEAAITSDGVDLDSLGLKRPTSTWTYLVTDNPFGTPEERFVAFVGTAIRDSAMTIAGTPPPETRALTTFLHPKLRTVADSSWIVAPS